MRENNTSFATGLPPFQQKKRKAVLSAPGLLKYDRSQTARQHSSRKRSTISSSNTVQASVVRVFVLAEALLPQKRVLVGALAAPFLSFFPSFFSPDRGCLNCGLQPAVATSVVRRNQSIISSFGLNAIPTSVLPPLKASIDRVGPIREQRCKSIRQTCLPSRIPAAVASL